MLFQMLLTICIKLTAITIHKESMAAYLHMPGEEILLIYDTIDPDSVSHSFFNFIQAT
jgi:hypothetical protein